jgi:hypothetical protein
MEKKTQELRIPNSRTSKGTDEEKELKNIFPLYWLFDSKIH